MFAVLGGNSEMFTGKFNNIDSSEDLLSGINETRGRTAYLTWIKADNIWMGLLLSPLKMFYFLFSPLPSGWHGFGDIFAFMIDSSFYIFLCCNIVRNYRLRNTFVNLKKFLFIGLGVAVFAFALGTFTAGTAMRHRAKLLPMLTVLYAVTSSSIGIKNTSTNDNEYE